MMLRQFATGLVLGALSFACGHTLGSLPVNTPTSDVLESRLERCRLENPGSDKVSCQGYLACRHKAQAELGYPVDTKTCNRLDGGAK